MQLCETELHGDTLMMILGRDLVWSIYEQAQEIEDLIDSVAYAPEVKKVVVDFHRNRAYSTGTLQVLARIWNIIRQREGRMVLCNVSESGMQAILRTNLHEIWTVFATREDALAALTECSS